MNKVELFGIQFNNFDFRDLADYLENTVAAGEPTYLLTCNVDHVMCMQKDALFRRIYRDAHAVVADGMPIVWTSRLAGKSLKQRVAGSDLLTELGLWLEAKRYRLFFLGAAEGVAEEARRRLLERFPALSIVGCYSPPYGFETMEDENRKIVAMIREAKPDILLVGVGAPKQEKWIYRHYREYGVPVSIGVGATFDFLAGKVKRAPVWMQRAGLEWSWRLMCEPGRLWRRYLVQDVKFIRLMLAEWRKAREAQRSAVRPGPRFARFPNNDTDRGGTINHGEQGRMPD
jgi:N-acetylglucosaminyldiphosphoundecaprenol N-acetyl-beta-D-mannosaminyltransferase